MYIAIAQMNPTVGDIAGNAETMLEAAGHAKETDADIIVFPAHALTGFPLAGLADSEAFVQAVHSQLAELASKTELPMVFSVLSPYNDNGEDILTSELVILDQGEVHSLGFPEFAAPDETFGIDHGCDAIGISLLAHFAPGFEPEEGDNVLLEICADLCYEEGSLPIGRGRTDRLIDLAKRTGCYVAYVNLAGASDSFVFAGGSAVVSPEGEVLASGGATSQELIVFDSKGNDEPEVHDFSSEELANEQVMWDYAVVSVRDYVRKNGFGDVVVGLSGGIDSAVVATIAVDALGSEHVHGVLMPGKYSSEGSVTDALELARNLHIETLKIPIDAPMDAFCGQLAKPCGGEVKGLTAENLQARIRCVYLMALSNTYGWLVLNTGNKSEAAMGFSTLYGDTAGVFAPIGNLYKTQVYKLAEYRSAAGVSIPEACRTKAPSAELYPGAKDEDRLPPYAELDLILNAHIEGGMSASDIVGEGFEAKKVNDVLNAVRKSEFKRRQEPLAPMLGGLPLTEGRAWPITNGWADNA